VYKIPKATSSDVSIQKKGAENNIKRIELVTDFGQTIFDSLTQGPTRS